MDSLDLEFNSACQKKKKLTLIPADNDDETQACALIDWPMPILLRLLLSLPSSLVTATRIRPRGWSLMAFTSAKPLWFINRQRTCPKKLMERPEHDLPHESIVPARSTFSFIIFILSMWLACYSGTQVITSYSYLQEVGPAPFHK